MLTSRRAFFELILQFMCYSIIKLIFNKKYVYSKHKRTKIEINDLTFIQFHFFSIVVQIMCILRSFCFFIDQ